MRQFWSALCAASRHQSRLSFFVRALDAGARVLAELGVASHASANDLASWQIAIETMSGYADAAHQSEYAHRVFALLARGGLFAARDGETISLNAHDLPVGMTIDLSS